MGRVNSQVYVVIVWLLMLGRAMLCCVVFEWVRDWCGEGAGRVWRGGLMSRMGGGMGVLCLWGVYLGACGVVV
jgi:hypothetical protein